MISATPVFQFEGCNGFIIHYDLAECYTHEFPFGTKTGYFAGGCPSYGTPLESIATFGPISNFTTYTFMVEFSLRFNFTKTENSWYFPLAEIHSNDWLANGWLRVSTYQEDAQINVGLDYVNRPFLGPGYPVNMPYTNSGILKRRSGECSNDETLWCLRYPHGFFNATASIGQDTNKLYRMAFTVGPHYSFNYINVNMENIVYSSFLCLDFVTGSDTEMKRKIHANSRVFLGCSQVEVLRARHGLYHGAFVYYSAKFWTRMLTSQEILSEWGLDSTTPIDPVGYPFPDNEYEALDEFMKG